jgi:hypothetical protein
MASLKLAPAECVRLDTPERTEMVESMRDAGVTPGDRHRLRLLSESFTTQTADGDKEDPGAEPAACTSTKRNPVEDLEREPSFPDNRHMSQQHPQTRDGLPIRQLQEGAEEQYKSGGISIEDVAIAITDSSPRHRVVCDAS